MLKRSIDVPQADPNFLGTLDLDILDGLQWSAVHDVVTELTHLPPVPELSSYPAWDCRGVRPPPFASR